MLLELCSNGLCLLTYFFLTFTIFFCYMYIIRYWNFFSKNNVKFVRGVPFLGVHYKTFSGTSVYKVHRDIYNEFPNERFIGMYDLGGKPFYIIRDPELVTKIAIKDFDHFSSHNHNISEKADPMVSNILLCLQNNKWKDMRSSLTPLFTAKRLKYLSTHLNRACVTFVKELKNIVGDRKDMEFDMMDLTGRGTMDCIAACAFGVEINSMKNQNNSFYRNGVKVGYIDVNIFFMFVYFPQIVNFFRVRMIEENAFNYFLNLTKRMLKERMDQNEEKYDMINVFVKLLRDTTDMDDNNNNSNGEKDKAIRKWTDNEIFGSIVVFLATGYYSTSQFLSCVLFELALNPSIQERLYEETQECYRELNGEPVDYNTVGQLKYLDLVLSEGFRRWSGLATDRKVTKPYVMENTDGTKVKLNVGDSLWLPIHSLHMDEKYFPEPFKFDPERFSDDNKRNLPSGVYMPFGLGPRQCIGLRYGLLETKMLLFHLVSEFKFDKCSRTPVPFDFMPTDGKYWLNVTSRH